MRAVKSLRGWVICILNSSEQEEYGFKFAPIHPDNIEYLKEGLLDPHDADWECNTLEEAIQWVETY